MPPRRPINGKRAPAESPASSSVERLRVEYWPIERLKPYERNPRKNDKAVDRIRASIREFGFAVPVLARSDGEVIDGHLRLKGAIAEKMREVPVVPCDGWTDGQVRAFRLMVNRSVSWAEWDLGALALEFGELKALEFDLSLTGFDAREIDAFTLTPNLAEDDVPPVPEVPTSRFGDLWRCGPHRVLCGDATNPEAVARLLDGRKPFLMVTDPPYGVDYDPKWRAEAGVNKNRSKMGEVSNDHRADWREAWELFKGPVAYVWHAGRYASTVQASLEAAGFQIRSQIIWAKDRFALSRGHYHWQHEPCWYAVRTNASWNGDRSQSTLWSIKSREDAGHGHGTQKPVECMRRPILNHTVAGASVYDPFLGSGSTLVAAELTGRACYGLEIDPRYCDVIIERWEKLTGKQATLSPLGATFEHVKEGRRLQAEDALKEELMEQISSP
jgi:DNA modification methylase